MTSKSRPVILSAPEVRAALDTGAVRVWRAMKPQPEVRPEWNGPHVNDFGVWYWIAYPDRPGYSFATQDRMPRFNGHDNMGGPYIKLGDALWVRETFRELGSMQMPDGRRSKALAPGCMIYRADGHEYDGPWRSPATMPRWASRIDLEVTGVQVWQREGVWYWLMDARVEIK